MRNDTSNREKGGQIHSVIVPFYLYASVCYLAGCILLFITSNSFKGHYFAPGLLALTHTMALGWATMLIIGSGYQLLPVLTGSPLYSAKLARASFWLAGAGIPVLVYNFYLFRFDEMTIAAAVAVNLGVIAYLINTMLTVSKKNQEADFRGLFLVTAAMWLVTTTLIGLLLVINFTVPLLDKNSLYYLSLHAHIGIVGWFLLTVTGIGTRLIPMFLISKFEDPAKLRSIYILLNIGLAGFIFIFIAELHGLFLAIPVLCIAAALCIFFRYCFLAYKERLRKQADSQIRLAFISFIILCCALVAIILLSLSAGTGSGTVLLYGFMIFFGWITSLIAGMTFKTLPFIIWNKVYHDSAWDGSAPDPKDLFSNNIFKVMGFAWLTGFLLFAMGILFTNTGLLASGSLVLILSAILYNFLVIGVVIHKKKEK